MGMWGQTRTVQTATYGFESGDDGWTATTFVTNNTAITAHGGSKYGATNGTTADVKYNAIVESPQSLTCYYSKTTTNTNANSKFHIQVSTNNSTWTTVASGLGMDQVTKGTWYELTADLSSYSNVYVRVRYDGTTGVRALDDITLIYDDGTTPSTDPEITFTPSSITLDEVMVGNEVSTTFSVGQANLTSDIALSVDNGSLSTSSIAQGAAATTVTWTYTPTTAGAISATVTATSGTATETLAISGTAIAPVEGYDVDFEYATDMYPNWTFNNMTTYQTGSITAHGGTYYGTTGGKATASITTTSTVANPGTLTCYVSKQSGNTTSSTWYIQVSENGSTWTDVESHSATSMSQGSWVEFTADLTDYTDVYVRVYYSGSTAIRNIDDLTLTTVEPSSAVATTTTINVPQNINTDIYQGTSAGTLTATVTAEGNTISGATVTWSSGNTGVATIDANGAVTLVAVGTTTITASYAGVEDQYRPSSATYELTVTDSNAPGTINNPYTVAQALAATPSSDVYVRGIISTITEVSTSYGNATYRISDDGTTSGEMIIYRGKYLNNVNFTSSDQIQVGDEVVVTGTLQLYSGANQLAQNNYLVSLVRKPSITVDAANNSLAIPDQIIGSYDATGFATLKVSGSYLTADVTLTLGANSAFEMSTDLNTWSSTITISQSNGSISNEEVAIRLKESLSVVQQYTDNITLSSTGADNVVVALLGNLTNQTYTIEQYSSPTTAHGTITFAYEGPLYESTTVTMTATPADGYEFTANSWMFYNADEVEPVTLTVTDGNKISMPAYNLAVDATFAEKDRYAISTEMTPANSGTIVTENAAWEGKVVEVEVEAGNGFAFSNLVVYKTGDASTTVNVSGNATAGFTFTMPAYAVTVSATFVVNYDVTYDFSTADNFYTTAGGQTHPATGSSNSIGEFYYGNGDMFTASGNSHYFGSTNAPYFLLGKSGALLNLPTFDNYKITQITLHSSTGHSTSVKVAIVDENDATVAAEQTWSEKDEDYTYSIPAQYQTSALSVKVTNAYNTQFTSITLVRELIVETYTLTIDGYTDVTEGTNNKGYYLIASPVTVDPSTVDGMTEDNFDLYYFDQSAEDEWRNYEASNFSLVPGKGYLYAKKGNDTYNFTLTGTPYTGDGEIGLDYDDNAEFPGWNLVGNPFGNSAEISDDYYEINSDGSELIVNEDYVVDAMQGVFVIAENSESTVIFEEIEETPSNPGAKVVLNVVKNRGNVIDRAIVRFGEGRQLPKFMLNPDNTKLYITEGNQDFAMVRSAAEGEMPVSFKAAENGNYTLSIDAEEMNMSYLHLIDNMTGADIDLLATPSYSFEARTTDYANRFKLSFKANTGVEENATSTFAYYNGSAWNISNMGEATLQVVDMMGRVLSSETISGNVSISLNQPAGVYMLRLVNGDKTMVQKVVVR
jgi:hypothetical protein